MRILAVIPARGGSKSIPHKNLRLIDGKPLIAFCIEQAHQSRHINRTVVSTDDPEIANVARAFGAEVPFIRPGELATDNARDLGVFEHCLKWLLDHEAYVPDLLVQLRPTAPVRRISTVDDAIELMISRPEADSLRSVTVAPVSPHKMWWLASDCHVEPVASLSGVKDCYDSPRQELPLAYVQDGFVDIIRPSTILLKKSMAGDTILGFTHVDPVIDIDDEVDIQDAELAIHSLRQAPRQAPANFASIGIMQGRLTQSDLLQAFPHASWEEEFATANSLQLGHIEMLIQREPTDDNPLLSVPGQDRIRALVNRTGVQARVCCIDYCIAHSICELPCVAFVCALMPMLRSVGIRHAVLPLFEKSDPHEHNWQDWAVPLRCIADAAKAAGIIPCVESSLAGAELLRFLGMVSHRELRVCYDTGNPSALGHDISGDIRRLGPLIAHVHLKDKDDTNSNVFLGAGRVDFDEVFQALALVGYTGIYTLETCRGKNPVATAALHRDFALDRLARSVATSRTITSGMASIETSSLL